ncbi:MAG TPA: sulfur carrier protein ThiS [archaeon]|nr:sulfur carrier protein ThiS [archaeon]
MTVFINGKERTITEAVTLDSLVETYRKKGRVDFVSINDKNVFKKKWFTTVISEGARVEFYSIRGGG